MILEQWVQTLEARLFGWGAHADQVDPLAQIREQAEELSTELHVRNQEFAGHRGEIVRLQAELAEKEFCAAQLATRIETFLRVGDQVHAWEFALELDQFRAGIQLIRVQLENLEKKHQRRDCRRIQVERSLAMLQRKLYS